VNCSLVDLTDLTTIVATGPFDDLGHAEQLGAAFIAVQRTCPTQFVLLGTGAYRSAVVRRAAGYGMPNRVHLVGDRVGRSRSSLLAVADVIVPSPTTGTGMLLDLMAAGRAVAASASPVATRLILPAAAGPLYWPRDVSAMTAANREAADCTPAAGRIGSTGKISRSIPWDSPLSWTDHDRALA
jgi:glycosyltransferase involved in cell wall biosynthesis